MTGHADPGFLIYLIDTRLGLIEFADDNQAERYAAEVRYALRLLGT